MSNDDGNKLVRNFFDARAKDWTDSIPQENFVIAQDILEEAGVTECSALLDVGAGTGILYSLLEGKAKEKYLGIDISPKMVEVFLQKHPNAHVRCLDFEFRVELETKFDAIILFNGIPHFSNLDMLFENAWSNLKTDGRFVIAHSKTREGLRRHHQKIGYVSDNEPIPSDICLTALGTKKGFRHCIIKDDQYFYFSCTPGGEDDVNNRCGQGGSRSPI